MEITHLGSGIWSYTRRTIGAIFRVTVPATMMRSDWRGLGLKIPAPNRSMSKREAPVAIISIAQHAKPKVIGQRADLRAQLKTKSTDVIMMFFSNRSSIHAGIKSISYGKRAKFRVRHPIHSVSDTCFISLTCLTPNVLVSDTSFP